MRVSKTKSGCDGPCQLPDAIPQSMVWLPTAAVGEEIHFRGSLIPKLRAWLDGGGSLWLWP
jgi:hypothetical protein